MAERNWTHKQKQAIDTRDRTLLVSAAAGSGKTATLTERIIRSLMDESAPVSVDRLLVVTFTNAAAAELRVKISLALEEAVEKNPDNKGLVRQLFMLPEAKIRTIDSFCGDILRANADRVGVPFNYRIADAAECELLAVSVIDGLIEAVYSGLLPEICTPSEFEELADCLTDSKRTEEISEVLRYIYERCESDEDGIDSLARFVQIYDPENFVSVKKSLHGNYLFERTREMASYYKSVMEEYKEAFLSGCGDDMRYADMAASDIFFADALLSAEDYSSLRDRIFSVKLMTRPRVKEKTEDMESYADIRDGFKDDIRRLLPLFNYTEAEWRQLYADLYRLMSRMYKFLLKFHELYAKEKLRRGILSYADVERYAHDCLINDGVTTDIAENIKNSYSAVYIDEYQDVNGLQNSIFRAISKPDNCFMVGDIKQSIYGFRSARPEIFAEMKSEFAPIDDAAKGEASSVFMSNNFRCDRAIVDFVNSVFDRAFSLTADTIGYCPDDALVYSKPADKEPEYIKPEICLIERQLSGDGIDEEDSESAPEAVAAKIEALLSVGHLDNGEPVAPGDIAILMRNARGKDSLYAEALSARGIPVKISGAKSFFLSSEVLLALCLLNTIDNPKRDIYLAGLLCSPLYSFTADELYIVKHKKQGTLYDALVEYTRENPDFEKGADFLCALSRYRALSEGITVSELLFKLYHETGLLALASKSGGKENLMLLYDYASEFSAGEGLGLYNFIHFINSLIDKRTTFDDTRESAQGDAVRILTCHASKGLEFPVVFLVDAGARIKNKDASRRIAYSDRMGIAFRLRTPSGLSVVNNPVIDIVNHYGTRKNFEEELRVLYVALTRARERLYIVGSALSSKTDEYLEKINSAREHLTEYSLRKLASYMEIILATTGAVPKSPSEFSGCLTAAIREEPSPAEKTDVSENKTFSEELYRRFTFEYKNAPLTKLPEKLSVSKSSPDVLDGSDDGAVSAEFITGEDTAAYAPRFISGSPAEESAKRGIATHLFMQFCDLDNLAEVGALAELSRLTEAGYISRRDGERVRISELNMFLNSELFGEMRGAKKLYRELRFNVRLPAEYFTEEESVRASYKGRSVLIQGVIDCIIEYPDGKIGVFDYKTDRLSAEELSCRSAAEKTLTERHGTQLKYYALAAERIFGKKPSKTGVYSLHLGDTVIMEN